MPSALRTPTVAKLELFLPRQLGIDPRGLAVCRVASLDAKGPAGCDGRARIGTGSVTAVAAGIVAKPKLALFYGGGANLLLNVFPASPIDINQTIVASLASANRPYA